MSFLESIGAWDHVEQDRVQPYDEMEVWDGSGKGRIQFDWRGESVKNNAPLQTIAIMTENSNLTRGLLQRIEAMQDSEVSLLDKTSVASINSGEDDPDGSDLSSWPVVSLTPATQPATLSTTSSNSQKIATRLLIGADGFNSPVKSYAGINSSGWDYGRHGVVATLKVQPKDDSTNFDSFFTQPLAPTAVAYQRFLPALGGPIALLPLPNNFASLVWSTTTQNAAYLKSLPEASLLAMINAAFQLDQVDLSYMLTLPPDSSSSSTSSTPHESYTHAEELAWRLQHTPSNPSTSKLPTITSIQPGTIASFPLRFRHASTYIAHRLALIGDAAHTIHPLAGQGLNLGLSDAQSLFRTIEYAVEHGMDLGDMMALERYNRECWGRNAMVGGACDLFHRVYGVEGRVAGWARGVGMGVVNSVDWLKGAVMRGAEG